MLFVFAKRVCSYIDCMLDLHYIRNIYTLYIYVGFNVWTFAIPCSATQVSTITVPISLVGRFPCTMRITCYRRLFDPVCR